MLSAQGPYGEIFTTLFMSLMSRDLLWAERDLFRATPDVTRNQGFAVTSKGPPHSVAFYDTQGDADDLL
jgi:hypothetical protein